MLGHHGEPEKDSEVGSSQNEKSFNKLKVAVGQVFHEGNSFNLRTTDMMDFTVLSDIEILAAKDTTGTALAGILNVLAKDDVDIVPTTAAFTSPGGPVCHAFWESLRDKLVRQIVDADPDLVLLDLHGSMITTQEGDPEGDLLTRLRQELDPSVVIGASLDLHAHVTREMCKAANALVACKNNPHDDYFQAGQRVARICLDAKRRGTKLALSSSKIPMILYGNDETSSGPLNDINQVARALETGPVLDVSIFNVQAFLDVPDIGQVVTVITEDAPLIGEHSCKLISEMLLEREPEFRTNFISPDVFWKLVEQKNSRRPFAVSDFGDRVLAGAAGDSTVILSQALQHNGIRAAIPVTDPATAKELADVAIGQSVTASIGGAFSDSEKIAFNAVVHAQHSGRFVLTGQWRQGEVSNHGRTTVLRVRSLYIIVTERPAYSQDVNFFQSLGLKIEDLDFVVCKSGFHFKLAFQSVADPIVLDTCGVAKYDPTRKELKRPRIWPETEETPKVSHIQTYIHQTEETKR